MFGLGEKKKGGISPTPYPNIFFNLSLYLHFAAFARKWTKQLSTYL